MPDLNLFDKTEVWLEGVTLDHADLGALAAAAADVLSLPRAAVFVTDVRDSHVVFDILVPKVRLEDVIGREPDLIAAVGSVPGVHLASDASVHSHGVLGVLGTPKGQVADVLDASTELDANLRAYVSRRVAIISTGAEVATGQIDDTNFVTASTHLTDAGFEVEFGGVAPDDERAIAGLVARVAGEGFGLIITTGGVGAEDKDRTIEALQQLDSNLATAVLATYEVGHGRHRKPHVRVACGTYRDTIIVALPGPTREVAAALPALTRALHEQQTPARTAEAIAEPIREMWRIGHSKHHG